MPALRGGQLLAQETQCPSLRDPNLRLKLDIWPTDADLAVITSRLH
jgi:hypothetical protein